MNVDWDWVALLLAITIIACFGSCDGSAEASRRKCVVEVVKAGKSTEEAKGLCK